MNKRLVSIIVVLLLVAAGAFAQDSTMQSSGKLKGKSSMGKAKTMKLTGYIVDGMCAKEFAKSKDSCMIKAAGHTKSCALEDMCAPYGYGVFSDSKWYKFDSTGDVKAKAVIEKSTTEKGMKVVVTGKMQGDTFVLATIKEVVDKKPKKSSM
jgi:hypothetical protein